MPTDDPACYQSFFRGCVPPESLITLRTSQGRKFPDNTSDFPLFIPHRGAVCLAGGLRSKRSIPNNFHPKVVVPLPARLERVQNAGSPSPSAGQNRSYPVMSRPPLVERTALVWVGAGLTEPGSRGPDLVLGGQLPWECSWCFGPRGLSASGETIPVGLSVSLVQCVMSSSAVQ